MMVTRDLAGYGNRLPRSPWPAGTRAVISIAVHFAEGAEPAVSDGDPEGEKHCEGMLVEAGAREFAIESFFEYGARCGIWRLLRLFEEFQVEATFFCNGLALERTPPVGPRLRDLGHEIACSGWRYMPFYDISDDAQRQEIAHGREAVRRLCGVEPVGWCSRVPNLSTRRLLIEAGGFLYDSDSYDDDLPHWAPADGGSIMVVPNTFDNSDEKFWSLPNNSGFTNPEHLFDSLKDNLDRLASEGSKIGRVLPIALRPRIAGRPSKAEQVRRFIAYAATVPGVVFMTRRRIAELWMRASL